MVDKIKAMMPTMAWCPPPRMCLFPDSASTNSHRSQILRALVLVPQQVFFFHPPSKKPCRTVGSILRKRFDWQNTKIFLTSPQETQKVQLSPRTSLGSRRTQSRRC